MLTKYEIIVLDADKVHWVYSLIVSFSIQLLLAGFIVLPSTFWYLNKLDFNKEVTTAIYGLTQRILIVFSIFCFIGLCRTIWLQYKFRQNYVQVLAYLFRYILGNEFDFASINMKQPENVEFLQYIVYCYCQRLQKVACYSLYFGSFFCYFCNCYIIYVYNLSISTLFYKLDYIQYN